MSKRTYFPMTVVEEVNDVGRKSFAIRYADGRIIHRGYISEEVAQAMIDRLIACRGV